MRSPLLVWCAGAWTVAVVLAGCDHPESGSETPRGCEAALESGGFLMNPTATSVQVGLVPSAPGRFAVAFSGGRGDREDVTTWQSADPGQPLEFTLTGLAPGDRYRYRTLCETGAEPAPTRGPERSFTALRPPGEVVRFGFVTDSHAYREWSRARLLDDPVAVAALRTLESTLDNVVAADLDFMIAGGDEVMTHCTRCPGGDLDGVEVAANTVGSLADAELRYRILRRIFSRAAHSTPFFLVLGNHDGEAGFGDPKGTCGHGSTTRGLSLAARHRFLASPGPYRGGPDGNYFAFESGDALFLVLDVMAYTTDYPRLPEDWTLGPDQLRWLEETLAGSDRAWKFIFAHHLVGGHPRRPCYAYGRGGIRATHDGGIDAPFRGEQAAIHELMKRHGAQFFLYGHDHVFAFGEKPNGSGGAGDVYFVAGGHSSGRSSGWVDAAWFRKLYDHDADGSADFLADSGFLKVTVDRRHSVRFEYVASDPVDPERNGRVIFDRTVVPGR